MLQGFAITAASVLVGCTTEEAPGPDAGPSPTGSMCGQQLCVDLNDSRNANLTMVDGAAVISAPGDRIILVRTSTTAIAAVSDICTHQGCNVTYDRFSKGFDCPCHGSRYSITGTVLQGPATSPLRRYTAQLDAATNIITISL